MFDSIIANNLAPSNSYSADLERKDNKISCTEQVEYQHGNGKGYAVIFRKGKTMRQFSIPCVALAERIEPMVNTFGRKNDVWISQNTFFKPGTRKVEDIFELRHLYSDIDCHKLGFSPQQVLMNLEENHFRRTIPEPNLIVLSGQGLQLIWQIEPEPLYSLPVWQGVEDFIYNILKEYGADPQATDAARILRVTNTYNQKNKAQVEVYKASTYVHSLTEIIKEYILPTLPEKPVKPRKTPYKPRKAKTSTSKVKDIFNLHKLYWSRMQDIETIVRLRANTVSEKGRSWGRETLLFLYRYYSCMFCKDTDEALDKTLELNRLFKKPLSRKEVEHATRSAETMYLNRDNPEFIEKAKKLGYKDTGYNYSNARLIKLLEITPDEQKKLCTIISAEEKERRRTEKRRIEGRTDRRNGQAPSLTREEYLAECAGVIADNVAKAKELREQGLSIRKIAETMQIGKSTVEGYLKK